MTDLDLDFLIEAAAVHGQLAAGANPSVVAARSSDRRLVITAGARGRGRRDPLWTDSEDAYLRANLGVLSEAEMAAHLGRTVNGVHMRWSNYKHMPAPSKDPRVLTANQIAGGLGLDARHVRGWIKRGLLGGRSLPGGDDTLVVDRVELLRWLTRPESWPHFYPERVDAELPELYRGGASYDRPFWAKARRMLDLARARWEDEWLTSRQAADLLGVDVDSIKRWIVMGRLPGAVHLPNLDGRGRGATPGWAYWRMRRSHVLALPDKSLANSKPLSAGAQAFAVLAAAAGLGAPAVADMMRLPRKYVDHQLRRIQRRGRLAEIAHAHRLPVFVNAAGFAIADWKQLGHRLPALYTAMRRFEAGGELDDAGVHVVQGVLHAWCRFFECRASGRKTLLARLHSKGIDPFRPLNLFRQEITMNVTQIARQVTDFSFTLSSQDLERYLADPQAWAADVRAQLNGHTPGAAAAAPKQRRASKKSAPKARAGQAAKLKCEYCPKVFKTQGRLNNHLKTHEE